MCKRLITVYFFVLFLVVSADYAHSAGFALMQQGTGPMGQGNAFVAQADDPSALFFNPAGISQLEGGQAYLGSTIIVPRLKYNGPGNQDEKTVAKVFVTPQVYLTQQISPQIYFGFGVFSPFGLGTYWDGGWEGRYLATKSSLETVNLNPNMVYKKGNLAVSVGFNALRADLELKKKLLLPSFPDGESKLTDDTWGYGYNLGLLYHVNDSWQLGLSYRSKIKLSFDDGDADFEVSAPLKNAFPDTKGTGDLDLPPSLTAGISFKPDNKWTLEFDVAWIGWSTYDEIKVKFKDPVYGQYSSVQPKKWEDVFSYRFGVKYRMSDRYTFRAGYVFDKAPVPDSNLDPQLPDGDRHIYTAGLDWKLWDKTVLGVAYNFMYGKERHKDNEIMPYLPDDSRNLRANGYYRQRVHSVGLSLYYKF
ncbi:MAG: OmpP1/FadL family transporter [Deltaproteobacteria bacterium]|nr:OmpP1/FadL family transporter [Deltaproteobacteria bacterium]MDL1960786.1 OmpP1/FadL family transporter [Deltaproteobacteria bacterium]